jgi:hypothetical protein
MKPRAFSITAAHSSDPVAFAASSKLANSASPSPE